MAAASSSVAKGASGAALAAPSPAAVSDLLHAVVLSLPPGVLGAAAIELPVHEVASDVVLLAELGSAVAECEGVAETLLQVCRLIHNVSCKVRLEVHSSSWIIMCIIKGYGLNYSSLDSMALISLLLHIVSSSYAGLLSQSFQNSFENTKSGRKYTNYNNLWKFMDVFASKKSLLEGYEMSRFYVALLDCLHLVLSRPGVSLSEHVTGLVVGLKMFLMYGLNRKSTLFPGNTSSREKSFSVPRQKSGSVEIRNTENCRYVPPHLRKSGGLVSHPSDTSASEYEFSKYDLTSSDSDLSDSDRPTKDGDIFRSSKTRIAALVCIQDLCRADPKSLTSIWAMLLPINDVLQTGKYQDTLMACLLFDPVLKTRITSASALSTILEFNSSVFLQVAEYKESSKCGSFTTLSCSLGQILMQIHRGWVMDLVGENILANAWRVVASSHNVHIRKDPSGPTPKADQTTFMVSVSFTAGNSDVLSVIFHFSRLEVHPTALKALVHNYPNVATVCWEDLSAYVHLMLQSSLPEESKCRVSEKFSVDVGNAVGLANERSVMAAIKVIRTLPVNVLDLMVIIFSVPPTSFKEKGMTREDGQIPFFCLVQVWMRVRATSGFQGTDDLLEFGILKWLQGIHLGKQWHEVIESIFPLVLSHGSPMNDKQRFIVYSLIFSAFNDEVPSVRSAARGNWCGCMFPTDLSTFHLQPKLLDDIFHAVDLTHIITNFGHQYCDSLAIEQLICIQTLFQFDILLFEVSHVASSEIIALLFENCFAAEALGNLSRFANCTENSTEASMESTGNNIKGASIDTRHWLERMVQAFVSCVTTGNVKVQWNVCHALGNLFLNKTLKLQDVPWAPSVYSILLLLLRDSTNFKIRIHAAVALAVPESRADYGSSFSDILQSLEHVLESIASEQVQDPSSFKYRDALEKQLTLTTLHVLGLGSLKDDQALKDFLRKVRTRLKSILLLLYYQIKLPGHPKKSQLSKKISHLVSRSYSEKRREEYLREEGTTFLEQWLSSLCSSLPQMPGHLEHDASSSDKQENELSSHAVRKQMISRAAKSLSELYEHSNQSRISQRLEKMALGLQRCSLEFVL
ncbi:unnamed protein product [Spirodela intermedia]|uniref:DUF4042 domain-containing protein n=1 Tax=Spirodela intermedia TaxID=51605 RepID=A0A7I8JU27_SPIIN|nr:unnamed protein product [Spirodela intermedia]CAA6673707.1 unnamed protein product [Spirodela intermedia]